jgi:TrkA-N domain
MNSNPDPPSPPRRVVRPTRLRRVLRQWLPGVIVALTFLVLVFSLLGFIDQHRATNSEHQHRATSTAERDWTIPVFKTFQIFLLHSGAEEGPNNWCLTLARVLAVVWFLVISGAVVVKVAEEVSDLPWKLRRRGHVVIVGLGQIGLQVLDDLRRSGRREKVVVIEANPNSPWLEHARRQGADVIVGDATLGDALEQARAKYAGSAFVATGNDGVNLEVAAELAEIVREDHTVREKTKLYVHIEDSNLAVSVQQHADHLHNTQKLDARIFNVPRTAAAHVITHPLLPYAPKGRAEVAHFVIVGFGTMGQALAVQLAKLGHFPNLKRSRFTIADREINQSAGGFLSRYPRFTTWTPGAIGVSQFDVAADLWTDSSGPLPAGLAAEHPHAVQYVANAKFLEIFPMTADESFVRCLADDFQSEFVKPVLFICGREDRENFDTAFSLREKLACFGFPNVPTFAWMPRQPALVAALKRDGRIQPFGECQTAASLDQIERPMREALGRTLHQDYELRAVERGDKKTPSAWNDRDPFRESNLEAAEHLLIKLAALGYELRYRDQASNGQLVEFDTIKEETFEMLSAMEHNRWVAERLMSGWRYIEKAPTKEEIDANKKRKLHHDLVPWGKPLGDDSKRDFEQIRLVLRACQNHPFRLEQMKSRTPHAE